MLLPRCDFYLLLLLFSFLLFCPPFPCPFLFCFSVMLLWSLLKEEEGCLQFALIKDLRSVCFTRCTKLGSEWELWLWVVVSSVFCTCGKSRIVALIRWFSVNFRYLPMQMIRRRYGTEETASSKFGLWIAEERKGDWPSSCVCGENERS